MTTLPPSIQHIPNLIDPLIKRGTILVYRVFDIAEEVDLRAVENTLRDASGTARMAISRGRGNAVIIRNAPVRLNLGKASFKILDTLVHAELLATVWDYGVLSVVFQIPIAEGTLWSSLIARGAVFNGDIPGIEELNQLAREKARELTQIMRPALKRVNEWDVFEDYTIYFLEEVAGIDKAAQLIDQGAIPELILGEPKERLSSKSRNGIRDVSFQYSENDLVVIDWNSAIVIEPSGQRDIADVLEFALTHLLEFRYYDDLLDKRLTELYDSIELGKNRFFRGDFAKISHEANSRYIEFSEFLERIDNSLKVVGDFYLAVIFRGAIRRFRIGDWQESLSGKMNLLARVSELLQGEVNTRRAHMYELIIIVLIAFEIVSALLR
ncbi:MAG: hypothetical protein ACJ763_19855 [Bdellovibrionia bacterium]